MRGKILLSFVLVLYSCQITCAQINLIVSGRITNEDGKPLVAVNVFEVGVNNQVQSNSNGVFSISIQHQTALIRFCYSGYDTKEIRISSSGNRDIVMQTARKENTTTKPSTELAATFHAGISVENGAENPFRNPKKFPASGFSVNVDGTSYSNIYRYSQSAEMPFEKLVRIEEMINYFKFDYPKPKEEDEHPFQLYTELSQCPWNREHKLLLIGLQGKEIPVENLPPSNLVFLIDASKSMGDPLKLPLVKASMKLLTQQLRKKDLVSVVAYSGSAGVNLAAITGDKKSSIEKSIDELEPGGYTAGAAGIKMAYRIARQNFIKEGNNRIILCTDGDFNVGISSNTAIDSLIEAERKSGVMLSVLGFGNDNRHAAKMKRWAEIGNGNHNFINSMNEAKRLFVNEYASTLYSIAKEVKPHVYFNPSKVQFYRLIGYDIKAGNTPSNKDQLFQEGELGSGHCITALYEIIPVGLKSTILDTVPSGFTTAASSVIAGNDLAYMEVSYKLPGTDDARALDTHIKDEIKILEASSDNFRFAAAVAEVGLLLRESEFKQKASYKDVITLAKSALGKDNGGFRSDFVMLAENFSRIAKQTEGKSWLKKKTAL